MKRVTLPGARAGALVVTLAMAVALAMAGCSKNPTIPNVTLPDADSISVAPDSAIVTVGSNSSPFTVAAFDSSQTPISAHIAFASSAPSVFTVDGSGRIHGVAEGSGVLVVSSGAARDSAVVIVVAATRGWFAQASGSAGVNLRGAFFTDGAHGWVVGDGGRILATSDGGATWNTQSSGTAFDLESVWFTSTAEGWAVGQGGTILHTPDGGATWSRLTNVASAEELHDVCFATRDTGWVVGGNGLVLRTFDRGGSWPRATPTSFALNSVSFAGTRDGWAVGDNGVILGTHDRGVSWYTVLPAVTTASLRGVWRVSAARANAAGANGVSPRADATSDSLAWQLGTNAGSSFDLNAVCFPTSATGFVVGAIGVGAVKRSDDGGIQWNAQTVNTASHLNDVFFLDSMRGWAVGDNGTIIHTVTGGLP